MSYERQSEKLVFGVSGGFQPGPRQIDLYNHRRLEAKKFRVKKKRKCTFCKAKTKMLISCASLLSHICKKLVFFRGNVTYFSLGNERH